MQPSPLMLFGIGILIQTIYLTGNLLTKREFQKKMGWALLFSLFGFLINDKNHPTAYDLNAHLVLAMFIFMFSFSGYFSQFILPVIHRQSLIILNIIFIYTFYPIILTGNIYFQILVFSMTSLLLLDIFIKFKTPGFFKMFFSLWYLFMEAGLLLPLLMNSDLSTILHNQPTNEYWYKCILLGMITVDVVLNVFNIIYIFPIPLRESFDQFYQRIYGQYCLLCSKYKDDEYNPIANLALIVVLSLMVFINVNFLHLNYFFIISFTLLGLRYVFGSVYTA